MTSFDIRKAFSVLIFDIGEPVRSVFIRGPIVDVEYKDDAKFLYFPEIEELVEKFNLEWIRYSSFRTYYRLMGGGSNVDVHINFSEQSEVEAFLRDIERFKEKTEKIAERLSPLLPSVEYFLTDRTLVTYLIFKIGFHERFIKRYVEDDRIFRRTKYIAGISIGYDRLTSEERAYCFYGIANKCKENVALIKKVENEGVSFSFRPSYVIDILAQIIKEEKENIKFLLKYLLLEE